MLSFLSRILIIMILVYVNGSTAAKNNKTPTQPIKLYYLPPSPPCRVVMMVAKVMNIELELLVTNILDGAHMTPEFLKMNPQHTIPTIDDNGFILWESRAIITYLANAYGRDDTLYPKNPRHRAIVDQRLYFDASTLFIRFLELYAPILFHGAEFNEGKAEKLREALGWMEIMLGNKAYVAGDNMTVADISIVATITNINAFGFDYSSFENVSKWFDRMKRELEPYGYMDIDHVGAQILATFLEKD